LKLGTITIILKNSIMGGYTKHHPNATAKYQIEELGGDYAAMAEAFGGYAETITDPADLIPAYKRAIEKADQGIPVLLQIITKEELRMAKDLPEGVGPHVQV
jgi:acetolactate synthase-1/2/3 large subunit